MAPVKCQLARTATYPCEARRESGRVGAGRRAPPAPRQWRATATTTTRQRGCAAGPSPAWQAAQADVADEADEAGDEANEVEAEAAPPDLEAEWRELEEERRETLRELRTVRAEYDRAKWGGRWREPE